MFSHIFKKRKKGSKRTELIQDIRIAGKNLAKNQIISLRSTKWQLVSDYLVNHTLVRRALILVLIVSVSWYSVPAQANIFNSYSTTCLGDWQETQNASGPRTVDKGGELTQFDATNSAILTGGHGRIFCGGFVSTLPEDARVIDRKVILTLAYKEKESVIVNTEYVNEDGALDGELASSTASTSEIIANQEEVPPEPLFQETIQEVLTESEPEIVPKLNVEPEAQENNSKTTPEVAPEVIPEPVTEETPEPEPLSLRSWLGEVAHAQEETQPTPESTPVVPVETPIEPQVEPSLPVPELAQEVNPEPTPEPAPEEITVETVLEETPAEAPAGEVAGAISESGSSTTIVVGEAPIEEIKEMLVISYSINGTDWQDIGEIEPNGKETEYSMGLPEITEADLPNMQISMQSLGELRHDAYLDSLWVATQYEKFPVENDQIETDVPEGYNESPSITLQPAISTLDSLFPAPIVGDLNCVASPFMVEVKRGDKSGATTNIKLSNVSTGIVRKLSLPKMNPYTFGYFEDRILDGDSATLRIQAEEYATPGSSSYVIQYIAPGETNSSITEAICQLNVIVLE